MNLTDTTKGILVRLADLRPIADKERTDRLQRQVSGMDKMQLDRIYAGSPKAGHVFLLDSPGETRGVLETVVDTETGDSSCTLYVGHPLFEDRATYLKVREELIDTVTDIDPNDPKPHERSVIWDPVRGAAKELKQLPLLQLFDILANKHAQFTGSKAVH